MRIDGSCHCGRLTYEADIDPDKVGVCHCTDWQTLSGSAFTAFVPVAKENFRMRGERRISAEKDPPVFNLRLGTVKQHPKQAA
jgi:hypothetical protein